MNDKYFLAMKDEVLTTYTFNPKPEIKRKLLLTLVFQKFILPCLYNLWLNSL